MSSDTDGEIAASKVSREPTSKLKEFTDFYAANANLNVTGKFIILQSNKYKLIWDIFIMVVLLVTTMVIPLRLAFVEEEPPVVLIIYYSIDALFAVDIVLWFFTSYTDSESQVEVTGYKKIAKNYLKTWFFIDFLSIVPFDALFYQTRLNSLLRFIRIGKVYKMIRIFRLIKILKLIRSQ